jgi:cytochrome c5
MQRLSAFTAIALALTWILAAPRATADGHAAHGADSTNAIVERIRKVAEVCIEGQECAGGTGADIVAAGRESSSADYIEGRYNSTCGTCHAMGAAGAPKLGDKAAWEPRLAKGMDALYQSGIVGMPPAMPAKGLCMDCTDDEIRAIVDYMVNSVR